MQFIRETFSDASDSAKRRCVIVKRLESAPCTHTYTHTHTHTIGKDLSVFFAFFPALFNIDSPFSLLSCLSCSLCWPAAGAYEVCALERFFFFFFFQKKERKGDKREHEHLLQSICRSAYSANAT